MKIFPILEVTAASEVLRVEIISKVLVIARSNTMSHIIVKGHKIIENAYTKIFIKSALR